MPLCAPQGQPQGKSPGGVCFLLSQMVTGTFRLGSGARMGFS